MNWPGVCVESKARIKQVAIEMFKRYFHTKPMVVWHKDGFMAEVWDRQKNRVTVEQINKDLPHNK